ncbi:MAG: phosphopantetheine adenylyltransferase [Candidatus Bathyarchaeia archaeon]|jgi:pantetheine-phosphate adenylyltransferase
MKKQFRKVAVGGTFDELHKGHRELLSKAFEVGEYVLIGLTSDEFVSNMHKPHKTAPYAERFADLTAFLEQSGFKNRFEISKLKNSYGLTLNRDGLDALVVSQETVKTGEEINRKRAKVGLPQLSIVEINLVPAENKKPISTTRIRANEIDRNGHLLKHKA